MSAATRATPLDPSRNWSQTYSGGVWHVFDPRPEDVRPADFRALANVKRYGGHAVRAVDVAQHSVHVVRLLRKWGYDRYTQAEGLCHDLHEIYPPGDQMSPALRGPHPFAVAARELSDQCACVVRTYMGLPLELSGPVREADACSLATEKRDLLAPCEIPWAEGYPPDPEPIELWSDEYSWAEWSAEFEFLFGRKVVG
jgi:hypothetical protein